MENNFPIHRTDSVQNELGKEIHLSKILSGIAVFHFLSCSFFNTLVSVWAFLPLVYDSKSFEQMVVSQSIYPLQFESIIA